MAFLRTIRHPQLFRAVARPAATRPATIANKRCAHQDYGSGAGDPKGEDPQAQGKNPSEHKEHPGPSPPSAADKGNGSGQQQPSSSGEDKSNKKGTHEARPRFSGQTLPSDSEAPDEVQRHNREVDQRAEKAHHKGNDGNQKVGKGFWAGKGGVDNDP